MSAEWLEVVEARLVDPMLHGDPVVVDGSTRTSTRLDMRSFLSGTMLQDVVVEPAPSVPERTTMSRLRQFAPLSLRQWADVFHVSHTTIKNWLVEEPDRPELARVLNAVELAKARHPDVSAWLTSPLPGTSLSPIELLQQGKMRAFAGAIHAGAAPRVEIPAERLHQMRRNDISWAEPELPGDVDDE